MEKVLKLYTYTDGVNDKAFPSDDSQVEIFDFTYDVKRMGGAPIVTATIMYPICLDDIWSDNVYTVFNGEKYFLKQTPTSSYDNTDSRYKHEIELVSERIILDNVYFYDVVDESAEFDKPVSNSTKVAFFGDIKEFAGRLNASLRKAKVPYEVVVDDGVSSEPKFMSFEEQYFSNVLQEIYKSYEIPYYFSGKVIHIGFTDNAITHTFKYGIDNDLLSIQKANANIRLVNRITGVGSSDNIPHYYPNLTPLGDVKLVYNADGDGAYIKDKDKLSALNITNYFVYEHEGDFTLDTLPFSTEVTGAWQMLKYRHWQIPIAVRFNISDGYYAQTNIKFKYNLPQDVTKYVYIADNNIVVYKIHDDKEIEKHASEYEESSFLSDDGEYILRTFVHVYYLDDHEFDDPDITNEQILSGITFNVGRFKSGFSIWKLDNKDSVDLDVYGIGLNVTPVSGDTIRLERLSLIIPQTALMPSIYRQSLGDERFLNALNDTYISPETGGYYTFNNPYIEGKPKEAIVNFDYIKPTIVEMVNERGLRIDMFSEFAYDANDNDETNAAGEYFHPYFFAKLRKFDGEFGFNLFEHAIEQDEMVISMTSGKCGGCEWVISVDSDTMKNTVQVDSDGNLMRDDEGKVVFGSPQEQQNDTRNNEVWIALKKDIDTFGVIMPNAAHNYRPNGATDNQNDGDTFVILHIDLPQAYIDAAEHRLDEELVKYMKLNNDEKFNFSIKFSRIFLAENPDIYNLLNENARLQIEYNDKQYELYISSYTYKMSSNEALPEISVELTDALTVSQNALQEAISNVEHDIMNSIGSIDWLKLGLAYFLRKDTSDRTEHKLSSDTAFEVGKYVSGSSGAIMYVDKNTGLTFIEVDKLRVRLKAYFEQLEIINANSVAGKQIISPAGAVRCNKVTEEPTFYRCYFLAEQDGSEVRNLFNVDDLAYCQLWNAITTNTNSIENKYYWRKVVGLGKDYIDLSKDDCDTNSGIPAEGDVICHRGNKTNVDRQNFIEISSVDTFSPSITLYQGVNDYSLVGKEVVAYGVDNTTGKAYMNVYGDMYVGDREQNSFIRFTQEEGVEIQGKLTTQNGREVESTFTTLQDKIDGVNETHYGLYIPTLENQPASEWQTIEEKERHINDVFTNIEDYIDDNTTPYAGRSWRWDYNGESYVWRLIEDEKQTQSLYYAAIANDQHSSALVNASNLNEAVTVLNDSFVNAAQDGAVTVDESLFIDAQIKKVNAVLTNVSETYETIYNNPLLVGVDKTNLKKGHDALSAATTDYVNSVLNIIADNVIDSLEKGNLDGKLRVFGVKYQDYITYLNLAKKYIQRQILTSAQNALSQLSDMDYLTKALKEDTSIIGGLVQTSLLSLGYTNDYGEYLTMAGTNGIFDATKIGGGIAAWYGGDMNDMFEYYNAGNGTFDLPADVRFAKGVDRFDGTGYRANGKLWWEADGTLHADPLSFFVGEDSVGALLSSFIVIYNSENNAPQWLHPLVPFETLTLRNDLLLSENSVIKIGDAWLSYDVENNALYVRKSDGSPLNFYATGGISALGFNGNMPSEGTGGHIIVVSGSGNAITDVVESSDGKTLTFYKGYIEGGSGSNGGVTEDWVIAQGFAKQEALDSHVNNNIRHITTAERESWNSATSRLNAFLDDTDTDTIINKWSELETFLSGLSETDNLALILGNKANKDDVYTKTESHANYVRYVGISGDYVQTIKGDTTENLLVPFATETTKIRNIGEVSDLNDTSYWDNKNVITMATYGADAANVPEVVDNANMLINFCMSKHGTIGYYGWQMALQDKNDGLWMRRLSANPTTQYIDSWLRLWHSGNVDPLDKTKGGSIANDLAIRGILEVGETTYLNEVQMGDEIYLNNNWLNFDGAGSAYMGMRGVDIYIACDGIVDVDNRLKATSIQIGVFTISVENNSLKISRTDGAQADVFTTGGLTALA